MGQHVTWPQAKTATQHPRQLRRLVRCSQHDGRPGAYYPDGAIWAFASMGLFWPPAASRFSLSLRLCPSATASFLFLDNHRPNSSPSFRTSAITTFCKPCRTLRGIHCFGHRQRPVLRRHPPSSWSRRPPCAFYTPNSYIDRCRYRAASLPTTGSTPSINRCSIMSVSINAARRATAANNPFLGRGMSHCSLLRMYLLPFLLHPFTTPN